VAVPKQLKTEDLERIFGKEGVEALTEKIRENRKPVRKAEIVLRVTAEDYPVALKALEGRVTREAMVSLRQCALKFALERRDEFAGWLEAQTVAIEHAPTEGEAVVEDGEPEPAPIEAHDDGWDEGDEGDL
jgi:hypothetical protein